MDGEKADMVFTDPPYGVGYKYNSYDDKVTASEHKSFSKALIDFALKLSDKFIITPGCNNLSLFCELSKPSHIGCWTKTNAMSPGRVTHFWTWEPIFFYGKFKRKRGNDVFNFPVGKQPDTGDHTCPKPISLWQDICENFAEDNDLILDLFLGSGSTLIACEKTGRRCFGMEIDPHYCDVIVERYKKFCGKEVVKC
jgi:DNA modification methylase